MRLRNLAHALTASTSILTALLSCLGIVNGQSVTGKSNAPAKVPGFVIKYAPLVYLHHADPYQPSDIGAQLSHTTPKLDHDNVAGLPSPLTLDNLDTLNNFGNNGLNIYLTAVEDITTNPTWLYGVKPDAGGKTGNAKSCAVIVVDKGQGMVDAFYMYFYAFNWGGVVLGHNMGNHVGDWEHSMVRFQDGLPTAVWYSQHSDGQALEYSVLNKDTAGLRPIVFSGNGSHANFATGGPHNHNGFVTDHTDTGALWDPIKSAYWYTWSTPAPPPTGTKYPATRNVSALGYLNAYDPATSPIGWFYFQGQWGDLRYKKDDPRQDSLFELAWKYESGPNGPAFKHLQRQNVWPGETGEVLGELVP